MIWKTPLAALALFALAGCQPAASETPAVEAAAAPAAASDQTHCVIEVEGKVWLDKPCDYSRDYVLVVNSTDNDGEDYVYVTQPDGPISNAAWSGGGGSGHAHSPLGDLTRNGRCWIGDGTRICAPAFFVAAEGAGEIDPTHCLIRVDGTVWLDTRCPADGSDPDSVGINTGFDGARVFALINTVDGEARAYWNDGDAASHASTDLGVVIADGACWSNARVRICRPATPVAPPT